MGRWASCCWSVAARWAAPCWTAGWRADWRRRTSIVAEPVEALRPQEAGLRAVASTSEVSETPEIVVLAVKPQSMDAVLPDLKRFADEGAVFLSIAAGKTLKYFAAHLGAAAKVVRSMPNTPAAVRQGITVATTAKDVSAAEKKRCHELLEAVGQVLWVDDEALMDPVTALSGSGPAYVFLLVEAMAAAGAKLGLAPDMAMQLARATVAGSGELLKQSSEPASQLRINVTSPGGTTAEALKVLMADRRHPAGVRQGAGRGLAALEGTRGMTPANDAALDAFLGLIAEKGFAAVALRDVAEAAGLGVADLYRVYPDKVALVAAFMARIDAEVLAGTPRSPRSRGDGARPAVRRHDAPLRCAPSASRGAGGDPPRRHARPDAGAGDGPGAAPVDGGHAGGRLGAERRPQGALRQNGLLGDLLCRFPKSSTATKRPICPRPWPPWTAASRWRKDGPNSLINI